MQIYVSGLHSGPNPSPGVGVARCIRQAYPDLRIIGVDYSTASSGIHFDGFDGIWIQRAWNELDLELYANQIREALDSPALWISGLDLEARWLADTLPNETGILVPPASAFEQVTKPVIAGAKHLPLAIPASIHTSGPTWELHTFCRRHGWPVWCKGPHYEATLANDWEAVIQAISATEETWSTSLAALQADIRGREESVAFCAYKGELLDAVHMEKRIQTREGKTWAGRVSEVEPEFREALTQTVAELQWTGGAELECVRDAEGKLYLIDWNPRFPAWIYGAAIAGHNLPARLLEAAGFDNRLPNQFVSRDFTRVVFEIPARGTCPLPLQLPTERTQGVSSKHPSGMSALAKTLRKGKTRLGTEHVTIPTLIAEELMSLNLKEAQTPQRIFLEKTARQTFNQVGETLRLIQVPGVSLVAAYSVKTNPHRTLIDLTRHAGFLAEVISNAELHHVLACGFDAGQIILNGPAQPSVSELASLPPLYAIFADSLERLSGLFSEECGAKYLGMRLKPVITPSRFGIDCADYEAFSQLVDLVKGLTHAQLGVHFHVQSDVAGVGHWWDIYDANLQWARALAESAGKPVRCLDIGGGWFPDDFSEEFLPKLPAAVKHAKSVLPELGNVIIEPGKALAQPSMALLTRVLEVRRSHPNCEDDSVDLVVDASIADLPLAARYPHRMVALDGNDSQIEGARQTARILGRNCMESDIIASRALLPKEICPGHLIAILDVGAYDASMSYEFAGGRYRHVECSS